MCSKLERQYSVSSVSSGYCRTWDIEREHFGMLQSLWNKRTAMVCNNSNKITTKWQQLESVLFSLILSRLLEWTCSQILSSYYWAVWVGLSNARNQRIWMLGLENLVKIYQSYPTNYVVSYPYNYFSLYHLFPSQSLVWMSSAGKR